MSSSSGAMSLMMHVVGTRPNFVKAAPVLAALAERGAPCRLVHTGQHFDRTLSQVFFEELGLPEPDVDLGIGSGTHGSQTASLLEALEQEMIETRPGRVVVYGDVNSTLAAGLAASKLGIPIDHIEAGLRSFDRTMPEEINRVVTDVLANQHFVTCPEGVDNLAAEGISGASVHFVGNPMIDTLLRFRDRLDIEGMRRKLGLPDRYGVVTLHRPSNVDDPEAIDRLISGLSEVSRQVPLIAPIHPRGRERLERGGLGDHVTILDPLGYLDFMALVAGSALVLTDSGGIQEETTVLGIPCLTLRENTERPITVTMGTNRLVGSDPARIVEGAGAALIAGPGVVPPLWDGSAGERIAEILIDISSGDA